MGVPIVVFQPNRTSFALCLKELCEAGFKEGEDFVLLNTPEAVEEHIILGDPQVFVSGIFSNADAKATTDFAREMMRKNPALTAIAFSVSEMNGYPWKISITKADTDGFCDRLILELRKFVPQKV
jgi:hypothetical protein